MWETIGQSTDATVYFVMAAAATLLFLARLAMAMFGGGGDHGGDFDVHVDTGAGGADHAAGAQDSQHADSTAAFQLFSMLSLLAFFMGAGWMGLACRIDWQLGSLPSLAAAVGFGGLCMVLAAVLARSMRSLNSEPFSDLRLCVGSMAQVYLAIPARGQGRGKVRVSVQGRSRIVPAGSSGPSIAAFSSVKVLSVESDNSIVVEPQS
ncbi:MAG: hypothetical protein ACT4PU_00555 [Planctomycetota bacterium]